MILNLSGIDLDETILSPDEPALNPSDPNETILSPDKSAPNPNEPVLNQASPPQDNPSLQVQSSPPRSADIIRHAAHIDQSSPTIENSMQQLIPFRSRGSISVMPPSDTIINIPGPVHIATDSTQIPARPSPTTITSNPDLVRVNPDEVSQTILISIKRFSNWLSKD